MPLRKTEAGVVLVKDWSPDRIGRACLKAQPLPGEGMLWLQDLFVPAKLVQFPVEPRKVEVNPSTLRLIKLYEGV